MNKLFVNLYTIVTFGGLLCVTPTFAQMQIAAPKAQTVTFSQQPTLESAHEDTAIIRWTCNNPGGSVEHFGVVYYGLSPDNLNYTAKSHVRLNRGHSETMFRVRMDGLQPGTTYYYKVGSMEGNGTSDNVQSDVYQFTMPAAGERVNNFPQPTQP